MTAASDSPRLGPVTHGDVYGGVGSDASQSAGAARVRPRDDIAMMAGYHSPQIDVEVRLNTNESPLAPPEEFTAAVAEAVRSVAWNRYPDRHAAALRQRIADFHGVPAECVFAANGSNEVIQSLLLAYGGAGRRAAVFAPSYAVHPHLIRLTGTELVEGVRLSDFQLDPDAAAELIAEARPSPTVLTSPDNPSGVVAPRSTLEALVEAVEAVDGLLLADEAYGEFAPHSAMDILNEDKPLAVSRTYSKTWAMAAARLGYLIGPRWMIRELDKVALPYHLDSLKQAVGIIALDYADEMRQRVRAIVSERSRLTERLAELPLQIWPSGANFVLMRPFAMPGGTLWQRLLERSVLVRDFSSAPRLNDCLRVTVGTPAEDDRLLEALSEILT